MLSVSSECSFVCKSDFFRIKQNEISVREGGVAASKIEITDSDIITQNIAIAAQANILESSRRNY